MSQRQCVLFLQLGETMMAPYVSKYLARAFFVPEHRVLELISKEDFDAWSANGFTRYAKGDDNGKISEVDIAISKAVETFEATEWVEKTSFPNVVRLGLVLRSPSGMPISMVLAGLPDFIA